MSKPVKNMITESYKKRFDGVSSAVLVDLRGIKSNDNNRFRRGLADKQIKVTIVKNSLAKTSFKGSDLEPLSDMLEGPSAMAYPIHENVSIVSVARELLEWAKQIKEIQFKGALMEGITFGADEINVLSKYPTREEAQAKIIQIVLTPGQNLVGSVLGPGCNVASLVKAIREKLENGETLKKAG